jgi:hypothetical protein
MFICELNQFFMRHTGTCDNHPFWTVHLPHEVTHQRSVYEVDAIFWAQKWVSEPFSIIGDVMEDFRQYHFGLRPQLADLVLGGGALGLQFLRKE